MVKLTVENVSSKIGKRINLKTSKELNLSQLQLDDIGSFSKMESLEKINLSGNWFCFYRQVEKLFDAPQLKEINFTGNPLCKLEHYRLFVISHCPQLEILDNVVVSPEERQLAMRYLNKDLPNTSEKEEITRKEEQERIRNVQLEQDRLDREKLLQEITRKKEEEKMKQEKDKEIWFSKQQQHIQESNIQNYPRQSISIAGPQKQSLPPSNVSNPLFNDTSNANDVLFSKALEEQERKKKESEIAKKAKETEKKNNNKNSQTILGTTENKLTDQEKPQNTMLTSPLEDSDDDSVEEHIFVDARSNLTISNRPSSRQYLNSKKAPSSVAATQELESRIPISDESLFGPSKILNSTKKNAEITSFLEEDDNEDFLKALETKNPIPKKAGMKIEEDIFLPFDASTIAVSNNKVASLSEENDLFSLVDNKGTTPQIVEGDFNIDEYIANLHLQQSSNSGGLFDDQ